MEWSWDLATEISNVGTGVYVSFFPGHSLRLAKADQSGGEEAKGLEQLHRKAQKLHERS